MLPTSTPSAKPTVRPTKTPSIKPTKKPTGTSKIAQALRFFLNFSRCKVIFKYTDPVFFFIYMVLLAFPGKVCLIVQFQKCAFKKTFFVFVHETCFNMESIRILEKGPLVCRNTGCYIWNKDNITYCFSSFKLVLLCKNPGKYVPSNFAPTSSIIINPFRNSRTKRKISQYLIFFI